MLVSVGGDLLGALPELRSEARSVMTSTVRITRPGDGIPPHWDPVSESMASGVDLIHYEGPARLIRSGSSSLADAAGEQVAAGPYVVAIPWDVTAEIHDGDKLEIDGLTLYVKAVRYGTHRVEVRIEAVEHA